jgi:hypothetical protein
MPFLFRPSFFVPIVLPIIVVSHHRHPEIGSSVDLATKPLLNHFLENHSLIPLCVFGSEKENNRAILA